MKKLDSIFAMIIAIGVTATNVFAEERVTLQVSGVVCSFCAQGIKKRFEKTGAVRTVEVDIDKHEVALEFVPDKSLTDAEIASVLEGAGYNLLKVERSGDQKDQAQ